jgi:serine/threonine protein phosphatase PrpC
MSGVIRHSAMSHPGAVRTENQDAMLARPDLGLYVVADGAGGHAGGREAACRVVASAASLSMALAPHERLTHLRQRLVLVHDALIKAGRTQGDGQGGASTVVALLLDDAFFACLWSGDSRIYLLRDNELIRLTHDHGLVQELVDGGLIEPSEAEGHAQANVITHAIGAGDGPLRLDKRVGQVLPYDRFLLCSDGLTKALSDEDIKLLLDQGGNGASLLVDAALHVKARDNVTAIVVSVD